MGDEKYAYTIQNGERVYLRNVAFITNPARTKLLVVHNKGARADREWEPPKGLAEWTDIRAGGNRAAMEREVTEEAKVYPHELRSVRMLPYAYMGFCTFQQSRYMYQFWTATITEATLKKAKQRQQQLHSNRNWLAMTSPEIQETDDVDWYDASRMRITGGPAEKMIRAYLRLLNKHIDNV
jgi:hypothetical protein